MNSAKLLIACEESGVVRRAFRDRGWDAWSCDIEPARDGSPHHIQGDVLKVLDQGWAMMIAHPPCCHLACSGAINFRRKVKSGDQKRGIDFFMALANAPIHRICIEIKFRLVPVNILYTIMNMTGYTKLFGSIVASTIWREDDKTRIVWITMLALANQFGEVEASVPGLADLARVELKEVERALKCLMSPDSWSRTKAHDGRRIKEIDGGWLILNHSMYREKMNKDERREYLKRKQRERRARLKGVKVEDVEEEEPEEGSSDDL